MNFRYDEDELLLLETSLRNYIITEKEKRPRVYDASLIKYRGLALGINDENQAEVTFTVTIAGFEAQFRTADGIKVIGGLGGDERIIYKWYNSGENKFKLLKIIAEGKNKPKKELLKIEDNNINEVNKPKKDIWQKAAE